MSSNQDLPLFVHWMEFLKWLFPTTAKLPKSIRFTFTQRIENLALDIELELVEARYGRDKVPLLKQINLNLEQLRVLWRLCFELEYVSQKQYEYAVRQVDEAGRMAGGWKKQQEAR
ncbi:diversity-generating retroelement protein Avd [Deltaproteobacteria bacterium TL4]